MPAGSWQAAIAELREENAALLECLAAAGVLSVEVFRARLHRRKFDAARRAHPVDSSLSLAGLLERPDVALPVGQAAGLPSALVLEAACRSTALALGGVASLLRDACLGLYIAGGIDGPQGRTTASAERFSPARGCWEELPPMQVIQGTNTLFPVDGCLYACGGAYRKWETLLMIVADSSHFHDVVERLSADASAWEVLPQMRQRRGDTGRATLGRSLCVCGGWDGCHAVGTVERFEPDAMAWEELPRLAHPRFGAAMASARGRLYICGGDDGQSTLDLVESYHTASRSWTPLPALREPRRNATLIIASGRLYVYGGDNEEYILGSVEFLDFSVGAWETLPALSRPRHNASFCTAAGMLYLVGGHDEAEELVGYVECFRPRAGTWEVLPGTRQPKTGAAVVAVGSCLYVCGGFDDEACLSAERFDPAAGCWSPLPPMLKRRALPGGAAFPA